MGQSTFDQTMYNSTVSNMFQNGAGFGVQTTQKQMGSGAIRIEHSPSQNIIYAKNHKDFMHVHKKT